VGNIGFGADNVSGRSRVPRPADEDDGVDVSLHCGHDDAPVTAAYRHDAHVSGKHADHDTGVAVPRGEKGRWLLSGRTVAACVKCP
jgi:hypothetical protein